MITLALINVTVWLYLVLAHGRFWLPNTLEAAPESEGWPEVSVVIPARNEAGILLSTLPSLLANDYPALRITLVDDGSNDGTAAMATRIAEELDASDRLRVIRSRPKPGWKGKVSAMQRGLDMLAVRSPRYVLFTDADIRYDQGAIKQLVAHAQANGLVMASFMVRLHCWSLAERWLIPAFVYFFQLLYPFRWVNDRERKAAAAAGGCMLVSYDAITRAGGFMSLKNALIDDCALARLLKKQGKIWLGLTQDVHSARPYPRLRDIHAMVVRSAYDQLNYSPLNLTGAVLGMVFTYIFPVFCALFGHGMVRVLGFTSWAIMSASMLPILRFYGQPLRLCVTLPATALWYMVCTLDSAWQYARGRGGEWKGRMQAAA